MFFALRQSLPNLRQTKALQQNVIAGITVGIIALPLSMALAIAVGVPPQHGLYTAIVAGIVTALCGGSAVNISGPTAAFVVVLLPIVQQFGLGGLLLAGMMAGIILVLLGVLRLGRIIEFIPYPVVVGFTAGIAVVIASLQLKDFLGLNPEAAGHHVIEQLAATLQALPTSQLHELLIGSVTLMVLLLWPKLKSAIPGHLVALTLGALLAYLLGVINSDWQVATIGSRFSYQLDGISGQGIPPFLPSWQWPWLLNGADNQPLVLDFSLIHALLPPALTIAALGALESLLCAVVADGMTGKKHDPNSELIGQGLGNIAGAMFAGIPATAAIARTAANVRAGGNMPLAAIVHGLFIVLAIWLLAPLLAYLPMASMAAMLLVVAWNMSEAKHFVRVLKVAPRDDIIILLSCFLLTVIFDMTVAVGAGLLLAALLFIRRSVVLVDSQAADRSQHPQLPPQVALYTINGPLFFGSAQKAMRNLTTVTPDVRVVILDMSQVSMIDMSALVAMESMVQELERHQVQMIISGLAPRMILKLRKAGVRASHQAIDLTRDLDEAAAQAQQHLASLNHSQDGAAP